MTIKLSDNISVEIRQKNTEDGVEIHLTFKRKIWFIFYTHIHGHSYTINIRKFWGYNLHQKGGIFEGVPLKGSNSYGHKFETWPPDMFNLYSRIIQAYNEICTQENEVFVTSKRIKDQIDNIKTNI